MTMTVPTVETTQPLRLLHRARTMNHRLARIAIGTVLTIGVAACGSDDSTLTTAEYLEQANAICAAANPEIGAIFGELAAKGDSATPDDLQAALDGMVARAGQQIDDIAALEPPDGLADDVDEMIAAARSAVSTSEAQGLGFFETDDNPFAEADQRAADIGLTACAGG